MRRVPSMIRDLCAKQRIFLFYDAENDDIETLPKERAATPSACALHQTGNLRIHATASKGASRCHTKNGKKQKAPSLDLDDGLVRTSAHVILSSTITASENDSWHLLHAVRKLADDVAGLRSLSSEGDADLRGIWLIEIDLPIA
jgi:hypothetical protein